jgi:hypothetical protein
VLIGSFFRCDFALDVAPSALSAPASSAAFYVDRPTGYVCHLHRKIGNSHDH